MRRFWWVNHNKTARQEIGGEYLWSPKKDAKQRSLEDFGKFTLEFIRLDAKTKYLRSRVVTTRLHTARKECVNHMIPQYATEGAKEEMKEKVSTNSEIAC